MEKNIKRIGILTSGGDAPGMNAAIRAAVLTAESLGIEAVGIRRGYNGLIANDMQVLRSNDVTGLSRRGGTVLYTARSPEFLEEKGQRRAADNCRYSGIGGLVVMGGDGSFRGALELHRLGVAVSCVPCTIDNDIACTGYSIGFDTALNTAVEAVDKLKDTMQSHERCSVVEVMGRTSGHLALQVGIASGAVATLVPERDTDLETDVAANIRAARLSGRTFFMVVVAEGVTDVNEVAAYINSETGIETRVTTLGHLQRGGTPSARDRVAATRMGYEAVRLLAAGMSGRVVVMNYDTCESVEIETALAMTKTLEKDAWEMQRFITTV